MKVLHIFPEYLPATMVWAYQQIRHTPAVEQHIAGLQYFPASFSSTDLSFWPHPMQAFPKWVHGVLHQIMRKGGGYEASFTRYVQAHQIDLIHLHFGHIGADYASLGRRLGIPVLVSFYGFDYRRIILEKPRYAAGYQRMFQEVAAVTCEGPYAAQQLEKLGCPASKIRLLPLGVDTDCIQGIARTKQPNRLKLVQIATRTPHKGQWMALQAFEQALGKYPDMYLDFYGPIRAVAMDREIHQFIQSKGLGNRVRCLEGLPYAALPAVLATYDVFIHPSMHTPSGDCEGGAPIVLLDAQATGMPVIATTHCDIPFEVVHGTTGLLCAEGDIAALASAICTFAAMEQDVFSDYARQARCKVVSDFSVQRSGARLRDLYQTLTSSPPT